MRIGLVIYGTLETLSGGYLYDRELVKYLESCGDQVEMVSIPWRNYPQHLTDNLSRSTYQRLAGLQVDILLQDEVNHPSLFLTNSRLKKRQETPIIAIVHHLRSSEEHPFGRKMLYRAVEKSYLQTVDGFVFNSHTTREVVESLIGDNKNSVVSFPAGDRIASDLTTRQIQTRASRDGPLQVLFLGNVIARKGLHVLLDALGGIPKDQWQLSVVGSLEMDQDYTDQVMYRVSSKGLMDSIEFLGPLDEHELEQVMESSQLMVMPSSYEGFGIAYLEGMSFGLPAIASTAGGAAEIITHGEDGFLVPPNVPSKLREHLMEIISDRELLAKMSLAALERFQCHPTWENTSRRTRNFLQSWLNQVDGS
jgi:glycosyltransferase involved in cell wall biosynthesis